jgi:hypothetical protein
MKVATFRAKCPKSTCLLDIDVPLLSDFSYGEFMYGSIDGKSIKYYCGLDCKTWKFVDAVISEISKDEKPTEQGVVIQKIIGCIADRDDKDIYFTQDIYCPECQTKIKATNADVQTGVRDYPDLTFAGFESLNHEDRRNKIQELLKIIEF